MVVDYPIQKVVIFIKKGVFVNHEGEMCLQSYGTFRHAMPSL